VVRNGIGIAEVAQLEMRGVQGVWPLRASLDDEHHSLLAFSLVGQTAFLSVCSDDELEAIVVPGASVAESLYCGNAVDGCWLQVVQGEVLLLDATTREAKARWSPPDGKRISVCGPSTSHVAVACGSEVWYLALSGGAIVEAGQTVLEHDVACLDITPVAPGAEPTFCLVGLWTDISVRVLELAGMKETHQELLGGEIIPRSAVLARLEDSVYVV
jgi:DNA damage-binding protein 1